MATSTQQYQCLSRWQTYGSAYRSRNPRLFIQSLMNAPVAIGFDSDLPPNMTLWTFAPPAHDSRIAIQFRSDSDLARLEIRWRRLAKSLYRFGRADPRVRFREALIDLGDGVGEDAPPNIFAFARPRGSRATLIPNPYLLKSQRWLPPALPWHLKTSKVYFRGVSTGMTDYASNVRVALCKVAKTIPDADCRISKTVQVDQSFERRLVQDDLVGRSRPVMTMNRHKYLIDADGNTSSWDRYKYIGLFGGVPIRFECGWEECWHELLVEGVNCVLADRNSLPDAVERLRSRPREAQEIAMAARQLVKKHLSPKALRERLARTLSGR